MPRGRLIGAAVLALAAAGDARAEDEASTTTQEIGAFLGLELGGGTTPGGLQAAGRYLYRLSDRDWLDTGVAFTFGGGDAECFRDRADDVVCDHGPLSGFAAEASAGIRRTFASAGEGRFVPYAHAGVALRLVSFGDDGLRGAAVPLYLGGGVRARVADRVDVVGGALARAGVGFFNRDVGAEPQLSLAVVGGVEFGLD